MKTKRRIIKWIGLIIMFQLLSVKSFSQADCEFLIWFDEFDYSGLPDTTKWGYDVGDGCDIGLCGWGNNEEQYYSYRDTNNARVENGILIIEAKKEQMGGKEYTSARLSTQQLFEMTYGRIDISAKLPGGNGTWSALWLLGDPEYYGIWPKNGEIDIMEYVGHKPDTVLGTIHCPTNYGGNGDGGAYIVPTAESKFHEYSIEWTPDSIMFLVDDVVYHTYYNKNEGVDQWPYDKPFYLIFNVAIGGNLGGDVDENLFDNPVTLEVDYVRIHQQPRFSCISGKTEATPGQAGISYSTSIPANSYIWDAPTGTTITQGQGTAEVLVNWGCTSDTISLILETDCDTVTVGLPVSVTEAMLTGKMLVQPKETGLQYSIPELNGGTYVWTFPEEVTAVGAVDSNSIVLDWDCSEGDIMIDYTSNCQTNSLVASVEVVAPKIKGQTSVAANSTGIIYSTTTILNSTYSWILPADVTITSGQNTTSIITDWGINGGIVKVDVENSCGITSDEITVQISTDLILCNFETTLLEFGEFGESVFEAVNNPFKEGINNSNNVGKSYKVENAVTWAGIYADLGYELNFEHNNIIKMDVYAVKPGIIKFKIEDMTSGTDPVEVDVEISNINEWTTLTYNFDGMPSDTYDRITLFFDFGFTDPDIYYFDNIILSYMEQEPDDIFTVSKQSKLLVYPIPSDEHLYISLPDQIKINKLIISDMLGKVMLTSTSSTNNLLLNIDFLISGKYVVTAITDEGIYSEAILKH